MAELAQKHWMNPSSVGSAPRSRRAASILWLSSLCGGVAVLVSVPAAAQTAGISDGTTAAARITTTDGSDVVAFHAQTTFTDQGHLAFTSPYRGANSLDPGARGDETADATLYLGLRPWAGAEVWVNPELDQGFGLSNTLGVAGFASGEAYKIGRSTPYVKLPRLFLRQTFNLGGETSKVDADLNQFEATHTANRLVITVGKFGVPDIFDTNAYAHDPRQDFLNWSVVDSGAFDYAADAWGFSYGGAAELYVQDWTVRAGVFNLSVVPNSTTLEDNFSQYQLIGEIERRYMIAGKAGKLAITGFLTEGRMGSFAQALSLAQATGQTPSTALVRHFQGRPGISANLEQQLTDEIGLFARGGVANGDLESYEFSDIDHTAAVGLSVKGTRWARPDDVIGVAGVINGVSKIHQQYLAAGGLGILVGDGALPHPGAERILETYYDIQVHKIAHLSFDYQFIDNPAYNQDRGPVSVFAFRLHVQI